MPARRTAAVLAVAVVNFAVGGVVAGCSGSGGSDDLDRIDGPAQVDPDYDPLGEGTVPATSGG